MERRAIVVHGIVQGVGFRPFVHNLATRLELRGFVKNRSGGVLIEIEGDPRSLDAFLAELARQPPPLAQVQQVTWESQPPRGDREFHIDLSDRDAAGPIFVSPDIATCADCLAELANPADRRHGYPFLNCTNCGPRLTIITSAPYDRPRTTMASFAMCAACRAEYDNPADRRFHAQPTACPRCGPQLRLVHAGGAATKTADPLAKFAAALRGGRIGALKGLGGYHLVCDAESQSAVAELRRRKHRDEKPFAIMAPDLAAAAAICFVEPAERRLLQSAHAPIVLLRRRDGCAVADAVAPRNPLLGVLLPYTPLHHLLMRATGGMLLVMTSGNRADEPIAYRDADVLTQLNGIADLFLMHDRPIHVRCDDSVLRIVDGGELPVRRSRGYAPRPIELPLECNRDLLAVGGQLKATFALGRGRHAFLSHHLGDLDYHEVCQAFVKEVASYEQLFGMQPACLVHDLHPEYATTRYVRNRVEEQGIAALAVQHHHAHFAAGMAENGLREAAIGVIFDGAGYGPDGTVWGGEFLVGDYRSFERAAHLRCVGMPGGDQAIRQPWRMALAHLLDAEAGIDSLVVRIPGARRRTIEQMLRQRLNTPATSSAGRLFDAVASLVGVRDEVSYEGQAAIELEWLATGVVPDGAYPFTVAQPPNEAAAPLVIDTRPLIKAIASEVVNGVEPARIARRFHSTMVDLVAAVCARIRARTGLEAVVLSGGVFLNALLTTEASARLRASGFRVFRHHQVPPNDGGLSLGQLAVAAAQLTTI